MPAAGSPEWELMWRPVMVPADVFDSQSAQLPGLIGWPIIATAQGELWPYPAEAPTMLGG